MEHSIPLKIVVAATPAWGIGKDGKLPWILPQDMARFRRITTQTQTADTMNAVIMGKRTWRSIPREARPLSHRLNIVLSSDPTVRESEGIPDTVFVLASLSEALSLIDDRFADVIESIMIIGGARLFNEALQHPRTECVHLTRVLSPEVSECDVFMSADHLHDYYTSRVWAFKMDMGVRTQYVDMRRRPVCVTPPVHDGDRGTGEASVAPAACSLAPLKSPKAGGHEEMQYLALVREILTRGVRRDDRTGTGTLSVFGAQMRFSLRDGVLPLLTTKKVFWRGVAEELLWFISGSTDADVLRAKRVNIWDRNGSRAFLDARGLKHREEGDLGPVYGFQWRHFGAPYSDRHADYTGQGVDQLAAIIHTIRTNPTDRRMVMTAWDPSVIKDMALPPCHLLCQFYVADGELSCQMYQRSADMGLGVPFNIASYALLTRLVAQVCGLRAGDLVHSIGDAHVYCNHIAALETQLEREPRPFPTLRIDPSVADVDAFRYEHLRVEGYDPWPTIPMDMSV